MGQQVLEPHAHTSAPCLTVLGTPPPDRGLSGCLPQAGGACRGGEAAPRHFAAVAGARAEAAAAAAEWGVGIPPPQGQGRAGGPGAAGPRAEATPQACVLTVWPDRAHACSASCSVLKRGIRAAGALSSAAQAASK